MSNQGDDCYFYFYSTCSKGDSCPFRHCQAALGNETVCSLWQEGRCFRQICKFRHMEIDKKRSAIPCFWENQLSGCQKGNCAFHHTKGRYIDGVYLPPSKSQIVEPESSETELQHFQTPSKLLVTSTTHLREVKKAEAAENVPSPTHPPVVINAADDDEEDDEQISEERDESKPSSQYSGHQGAQRATPRTMELLRKGPDFGSKALEGIQTSWRKVIQDPKDDAPSVGRSLAQRLGKRKVFSQDSFSAVSSDESIPVVKKPLSERLGKRIASPIVSPDVHHKKSRVSRPLKDRLGFAPEQSSTEADSAANPATDFHIKTLQEIRQEKTIQGPEQEPKCLPTKSEDNLCLKRHLFIKPQPIHVKSLREIQAEKRQQQLLSGASKNGNKVDKKERVSRDIQAKQNSEGKNLRESEEKQRGQTAITWNNVCEKEINPSHLTCSVTSRVDIRKPLCVNLKETKKIAQSVEHVQIKTLEEIRKEKALKTQQNQQATDTNVLQPLSLVQVTSSKKRILRLSKIQVNKDTDQSTSDANSQTKTATTLDTKTTVDLGPPVSAPEIITEAVGSEKTLEEQSQSAYFADPQTEPRKIIPGKTVKGKSKVIMEPNLVKKQPPAKAVIKRKAQQSSPVAKVKPLNTTSAAKKKIPVQLSVSDSSVPQTALVTSTSSNLQIESPEVPASDPIHSSVVPTTVKTRRASIASSAKHLEDDLDELIWDISDGKLEDEINLDPSKDEDDLLMELSEMIDS